MHLDASGRVRTLSANFGLFRKRRTKILFFACFESFLGRPQHYEKLVLHVGGNKKRTNGDGNHFASFAIFFFEIFAKFFDVFAS